ncbi:MAG: NYN domain-containing protein, partial [Firmicutes bacterium]|nr:NYN domain-containing protein [Bacillota bacterium]
MDQGTRLLRIGIFYDGNYFYHVSNYYCYAHQRRARLSIPGLHEFIKKMISQKEQISEALCQIVDCHYFRGRLPAKKAQARQILLNERVFDDILMREGVVTHYLPMSRNTEKGVDVSLALETLELTIFKKFNIAVLIASDGDYVPLVRKLNALGTRVMVLGWDFDYVDDNGNQRNTRTSNRLMNEASYPIRMHRIINGEDVLEDPGFSVDSL